MNHSTDFAPPNVSQRVTVGLIEATGATIPIRAEIRYRSADPYALAMAFWMPHEVCWTFGRELLSQGLVAPSGDGDVHIFPCLDGDGRAGVIIDLCPPSGQALIQVATKDLSQFIARTTELVPVGTESEHIDVDTILAALLGSPAA